MNRQEGSITWLGQAGFALAHPDTGTVLIDPYLSDSCNRLHGFKRMLPRLFSPVELDPAAVLVTHDHADHFDADSMGELLSGGAAFLGAADAARHAEALGIQKECVTLLRPGITVEQGGMKVTGVEADHGELAPEAIGLLLEVGGLRIYIAGDTARCPAAFAGAREFSPHVAVLPINGAYGNLNETEAAAAAREIGAKTVLPCHFWMFKEHGGNPQLFAEALAETAPGVKAVFTAPGEKLPFGCLTEEGKR